MAALEPGGISLYFHIPFCLKKCGYCDFYSLVPQDKDIIRRYSLGLQQHLQWAVNQYSLQEIPLKTVYFGGGTPSMLSSNDLALIMKTIHENLTFDSTIAPEQKITLEANPESLTKEKLRHWWDLGVTRISLGLQSLQDPVLKVLDRQATRRQNLQALDLLAERWPGTWSGDLISAIPGRSWEQEELDLRELMSYSPPHISYYSLTLEEGTPFYQRFTQEDLGEGNWIRGKTLLCEKGYLWEEISNFARPGSQAAHNRQYWDLGSYLGLGTAAHSTMIYREPNTLKQSTHMQGMRLIGPKNLAAFLNHPPAEFYQREELDSRELVFERIMMGLRCKEHISFSEIKQRFGMDHQELISRFKQCREVFRPFWNDKRFWLGDEKRLWLGTFLKDLIQVW